jgi:signal transduction histidine kinase
MEYNLAANLNYCYEFFIDSRALLLYTHIPPIVLSILFGAYVFYKKRDVLGALLLGIAAVFSLFAAIDLLQWIIIAHNTAVITSWSVLGLLSVLLFFLTHWFTHRFVTGKNLPLWMAAAWGIVFIPILILTPTSFNLSGYDIRDCVAVEGGFFTNYYYALGVFSMLLMGISTYLGLRKGGDSNPTSRTAKYVVLAGAELFTLSFLVTGVVASYLVDNGYLPDFGLGNYGIAAMAVFIGLLAYATVRYQIFNIKLLGAQALVLALVLLVGAELFFVQSVTNLYLVGLTLALVVGFGYLLVRGVKQEIAQRERIEKLADELEATNQRQESLLHFVGHEVKSFLTKDIGAFAALDEGDFGQLPESMRPFVRTALAQSRDGARSVIDILQASNQKKGTVTYQKEPFDLAALLEEWVGKLRPLASGKGLTLTLSVDAAGAPYTMQGDRDQLGDHVLRNLIENSINYTQKGSITASLAKRGSTFVLSIADTGVGISPEDRKRLFTEGGKGKDSLKINVHSTGYGLFIAKNVVEAEGGTIRAESAGAGQGATFIVELPA